MGDEIGLLNDYTYRDHPDLAGDARWMHRPAMVWPAIDWAAVATIPKGSSAAARIYSGTKAILATRKASPQLASHVPTRIVDLGHPGLFIFERLGCDRTVTCLFNFTDSDQTITPWGLQLDPARRYGDLLTGQQLGLKNGAIHLAPYARLWLIPQG